MTRKEEVKAALIDSGVTAVLRDVPEDQMVDVARAVHDGGVPHLDKEVVEVCNRAGVLCIPGIMTPTEAADAMAAGADMLKMFPASTLGPGHIGAIQGPLGDVPIMPTGGVDQENVTDYFEGGAVAVGVGSALVDYQAIRDGDMDAVRESAAAFVEAVEEARR